MLSDGWVRERVGRRPEVRKELREGKFSRDTEASRGPV